MAEIEGRPFDYRGAAGARYLGYLALPERANGAAVLVAHAAPGLGDHDRAVARRLAGLGYVALAADYHGEGEVIPIAELRLRIDALAADPAPLREALGAALAALAAQPGVDPARIAAIGYCFGGFAALELARGGADVAAVVGFHSGLPIDRPEEAYAIKAKVLILNGADDPVVPTEKRLAFEAQMNAAGVDWQMHLYGGIQHSFTMQGVEKFGLPGMAYDRRADDRSWRAMLDFFGETIDPHGR